LVCCGICGRKMGVQHHAARERRSSTYMCDLGYRDGDAHVCQSMGSRAVDAGVVQAFLEAVSPTSVPVAMRVLDQIERDLAGQRRQRALQLEQARYDARLAQRQYERVDPDHRLVASELERRWNEKLERVAQLEQVHAKAEAEGAVGSDLRGARGDQHVVPGSARDLGRPDHHESGPQTTAAKRD